MRCPDRSADETARLSAVNEYALGPDIGLPGLVPIVDMAAKMFDCPASAVNMIGEDHVFLVAKRGIEEYDASRDVSFCAHAINQDEVFVIEDATLDPRFHDNPLVTGGAIRFYAGVPIKNPSGIAIGALCVIDTVPHSGFSDEDRVRLSELGKLVTDRLELRRIEAAGAVGLKRLETSAATSPNAIVCFDDKERITVWNAAAATMFGRAEEEAVGKGLDMLVAEEDRPLVHAGIARVLAGEAPRNSGTDLTCIRRNGQRFPAEIYWSRWLEGDEMHFGASVRDMTERRREADALYHLANFDGLTGLPNRNLLHGEITKALAAELPLALIVTDLEGFRDINNTLGNAAGDFILQTVAERIRKAVPPAGLVARNGGDEFSTLMIGRADPLQLGEIAQEINRTLSEPIVADGHEVRIAGNCGMALAPDHGRSVEEVMASANLALFQARSDGRGGSYMFAPHLRAEAVARRMYDTELHRAFERGEFSLFYQPQVRLADRSLVGAEALLRWRHPKRGLLPPSAFLPALEAGVLAEPVGRWIIDTACAQASRWREVMPGFRMSVNLFSAQFRDGNLPQLVHDVAAAHGLPPEALEIEITENIILDQQEAVLAQLKELDEAGFSLSFDDFGTGYASLNLLRNFPVSNIKIDKSFTQVMRTSPKDQAIVLALIELARKLGLKVIAEGVEDREDRDFLRKYGCEKGQGFLFGMPVPTDLFEEQFLPRPASLRTA